MAKKYYELSPKVKKELDNFSTGNCPPSNTPISRKKEDYSWEEKNYFPTASVPGKLSSPATYSDSEVIFSVFPIFIYSFIGSFLIFYYIAHRIVKRLKEL